MKNFHLPYNSILSHKYFRLILLISGSLWIILHSPLYFLPLIKKLNDAGITEPNPAGLYYYWIEFFAWILAFIPGYIFVFSSLSFTAFISRYRLFILVFINFFYALFRTFRTFDVTDTGFHFTKAWGLWHGSTSENTDFLVGTSYFNGLWLSLIGTPNVLWARIGYVLVVTGIATISYKIYSIYFNRLAAWLVFVVLSIFFIHYNYYLSINYDNLPVLSALAGIWFLLRDRKTVFSYVISGVFLSLTIWLKFNFVLIIFLPVVYAWVLYEDKQAWLGPLGSLSFGYLICLLSGILMLYSSGNLSTYIKYLDENLIHQGSVQSSAADDPSPNSTHGITSESSTPAGAGDAFFFLTPSQRSTPERMNSLYSVDGGDSHALNLLFRNYFSTTWVVLQKGAVLTVLLFILLFMLGESLSPKQYIILISCAFSIHYATYLGLEGAFFIYVTASILPGYFFYIYQLRYARELIVPTALILMLAIFSFPGSNLSFNVIYRSGAGLLLFAFPLAFLLDKKVRVGRQVLNISNYVIIFVLTIMFGIIHPWGYNKSHRDLGDRSVLVEMFKSPQLFGIHTFPQRVKVMDEALEFFNHETYERDNTPAVFLSWIPMMYYLTQTNCLMNNPWHGCVSFKAFKAEFDKAADSRPPVYITFSKIVTRNPGWPLEDESYRKKDKVWIPDLKKFDYIRYWMKDKNYSKVFENDMFEVYKQN